MGSADSIVGIEWGLNLSDSVVMCSWLGLSSVVSFEVELIVWDCGCICGNVGIIRVSSEGSVGM